MCVCIYSSALFNEDFPADGKTWVREENALNLTLWTYFSFRDILLSSLGLVEYAFVSELCLPLPTSCAKSFILTKLMFLQVIKTRLRLRWYDPKSVLCTDPRSSLALNDDKS